MEGSPEIQNVELSNLGLATLGTDYTAFREFKRTTTDEEASITSSVVQSDDDSKISYLSIMLFVTAIEDAFWSSMILDECSNKMRVEKAITVCGKLLSNKFGVGSEEVSTEHIGCPLECPENKLSKLSSDKAIFNGVLRCLITELLFNRSYQCLQKCVDDLNRYNVRSKELINACTAMKPRSHELRKNLVHLRKTFKNNVYTSDLIIEDLTSSIGDSETINCCKTRYSDKWQKARIEQHEEKINNAHSEHIDSIQKYKVRLDYEARAHDEVDQFNKIYLNDLQMKVENMMKRYDTDIEAIDLAIQKQRILYDNALEHRIYLEKTIAKHGKEIREWKKFKKIRDLTSAYEAKMQHSAIIVQAWWRGLLVRLELGPYERKKEKKGGKKKAKKRG